MSMFGGHKGKFRGIDREFSKLYNESEINITRGEIVAVGDLI